MIKLIIIILLFLFGVGSFVFGFYLKKLHKQGKSNVEGYYQWIGYGCGLVSMIIAGFVWLMGSIYTQDPGQASVLVSFTGEVTGINYETGLHFKSLLDTRVEYDIRNNMLSYVGTDGNNDNYVGGDVSGPQITFQDANGVSGNIDLNVRYSVRGDAVGNIYNEYKTQQEFVNATLAPDVRATTREILSKYTTAQVYNERDSIQPKLVEALQKNWDKLGVDIEEVYLQEVRYPDSVVNSFAQAQAARAEVEKAKAEQERAKIEAETNLIKSQALTDKVLKEKLIEAIKNGNGTYVLGELGLALGL